MNCRILVLETSKNKLLLTCKNSLIKVQDFDATALRVA